MSAPEVWWSPSVGIIWRPAVDTLMAWKDAVIPTLPADAVPLVDVSALVRKLDELDAATGTSLNLATTREVRKLLGLDEPDDRQAGDAG